MCSIFNFPLTVYPKHEVTSYKKETLSFLSCMMISSIIGNSPLPSSKVYGMSDYHNDPKQKIIRANVINEILGLKKVPRKVIFLLEGQEIGVPVTKEAYEALIGTGLIHAKLEAYGWENMALHQKGIRLIRKVHSLVKERIRLRNTTKDNLNNVELEFALNKITDKINKLFSKILNIAKARNKSLYAAIEFITSKFDNVDIFVIAGCKHFDQISTYLQNIPHCVINIKTTQRPIGSWEEWDKCVGDNYYPPCSSSSALIPYSAMSKSMEIVSCFPSMNSQSCTISETEYYLD